MVNWCGVVEVELVLTEADSLMTWIRDGAVKLRMEPAGIGAEPPMTVMEAFKKTAGRCPHRTALGEF